MTIAALLLLFGAAATALAGASGGGFAAAAEPAADSAGVVAVSVSPSPATADHGDRVAFAVDFDIASGWHLYAHGDSVFIGIDLKGLDKAPLDSMIVKYPEGDSGEFFGETVSLLAGRGRVEVSGVLRTGAELPAAIDLELELQACDSKICLAPARVPARVNLISAD